MAQNKLAETLRAVSAGTASAAPFLPGPAGTVAGIAAAALALAADFAAAGKNPIVEIERIRSVDPVLADMEASWADRLRERFCRSEAADPGFYEKIDAADGDD